ncbi:MAG: ATP-binding cassette domain-containing protein [Rhodopila sp.]
MTILVAEGVTRRFGGLVAVGDVSLTLSVGELHAVIGPNGAGKTTLTYLLSGELMPSAGRVLLGGTDVTGLPAWRRAPRPRPVIPEDQCHAAADGPGERATRGARAGR